MYSVQGQITYNGPFSTTSGTPTALTLGVGTNTISNNITTPPSVQNWFDVTLPANMQITNVSFAVNDPLAISSGTMCWNPFSLCSPSDTWGSGGQGSTAITGWSGAGTLPINSSPGVIQIISGIASNTTWTLVFTVISTGGGCTDPDVPTVTRSTNNICAGANVTLDWAGAALNDANNWHVYTTNCGTGQIASQTGTSLVVNPTTTTTYYIRGEDGAGCVDESTGTCGQVTVTVDQTLSTLTSATASTNNVCPSTSVSLIANGLSLGSGANFNWYTGTGGTGSNLGSSNPLNVSPATTTTYYAYATGTCNTLEQSITVTVDQTLSTLTSATASTNNVCPSTSVSLTANGLSLGSGANFNWYTGSGGTGSNLGSSNPLNVSPATTTTYYAYATGTCNTLEQSITVTVDQTLSTLTSATASTNNVCPSTSVSLTANGLSLGSGANFNWYTGTGGTGSNLGNSNPLNVAPATTTTYYAYATGTCNTLEQSITVTVDQTLSTLTSAIASTNNVCPSTLVSLTANGLSLGSGANFNWYTGTGGTGSNLGNSNPLNVSPATTTTYYAYATGTCNTLEQSITVTVDQTLSTLTSATASTNNVCPSTSVSLTANGLSLGSGANFNWYTGIGGTGSNLGNSNPLNVAPATTTTYYAYATGTCNTVEESITVTVQDLVNPTITCPATVNVNTDAASCNATGVVLGTPTTADNCLVASVTNDAPTIFPLGDTTVTWTVTDGSNNTATCTQTVTVTDTELPIAIAQDITITLDENGEGSITTSDIDNGSSDNCNFTLSLDIDTFDCFNLGNHLVVLSIEDDGGNITSATATVTILGNDLDGDLIVDACDNDIDGDGVLNIDDNCITVANTNQIDLDQDSIGDSCDDFVDIVVTPNDTITPNGDGQNDTWSIENIWRYPNATIKVFNRHGVKVFEGRNYNNNWGGTSTEGGSGLLPAGSYYYSIELNQPEFGEYGVTPVTGWMYINY